MPTFKQETLIESNEMGGLESAGYAEALEKSHEGSKKIIDDTMKEYNLDAFCGLTIAPAAMSGYPHITVPAGKVFGLPVGLSFFSGAFKEGELIEIGYAFEQASKNRVKPEFKSTFEI